MRKLFNPNNLSGEELEKINLFWKQYGKSYNKEDQYEFRHFLTRAYEAQLIPLIYLAIFSYADVLKEEKNLYKWYFDYLNTYYPQFLDRQILEIGCGRTPALVKIISEAITLKKSSGSITGIDSALALNDLPNAILKKEQLTYDTDISKFDTIIGLAPCEASPIALRKALFEEKEISLILCGCLHPDKNVLFLKYEDYLNHLYRLIKQEKSSDFTFDIDYVPSKFNYDYPILSLRKK